MSGNRKKSESSNCQKVKTQIIHRGKCSQYTQKTANVLMYKAPLQITEKKLWLVYPKNDKPQFLKLHFN